VAMLGTEERNAFKVLRSLKIMADSSQEPVMVTELQAETGLGDEELRNAWRYLKDKRLIEVFVIPYMARINKNGIGILEADEFKPSPHESDTDTPKDNEYLGRLQKWIIAATALVAAFGGLVAAFVPIADNYRSICVAIGMCNKPLEKTPDSKEWDGIQPVGPVISKA
jgi:hypothetical protein